MKNFIVNLSAFLLILFVLDRSFIVFRPNETNLFADISRIKMKKISENFNSGKKFDVVVLGSSHAQFGVSPEIISNNISTSCLNIAVGGGANIGKQLKILQRLVSQGKSKSPNIILFGMDVFTLNDTPVYDDKVLRILFNETPGIRNYSISEYLNSYAKLYIRFIPRYLHDIKNGSYLLPYFKKGNSYDLSMFSKYVNYDISRLGWVKGNAILNKNFVRYSELVFKPNNDALNDLAKLIRICKDNNIRLIFFQVPEHSTSLKYKKKYELFAMFMNQLSEKNKLTFWDYDKIEKFPVNNDLFFFDSDHLNAKGAQLFTTIMVEDLKKAL